jgi:hypothetical protein
MAPFMGPTREWVLSELRGGRARLPMTLGKYAPQATIERDGDVWRLRPLVLDKAASEAAYREAMGPGGSGFWMPESEFQFLKPGVEIVREETLEAFVEALAKVKWVWS